MDKRAIGVFDSGLGGLTSVKRLVELLPNEDIIYLGDTGRVPYGSRSRETIIKYTREDADFLIKYNVKAIVVACNTVSAAALDTVEKEYGVPMIGAVDAAVRRALETTKNGKIGVIGTAATINSGIYPRKIGEISKDARVFTKACPLLVPLVENGRVNRGDVVTETVVREYLSPVIGAGVDTLILGCTHYPLLMDIISDIAGDGVALVNSGGVTAEFVAKWLEENDMLNDSGGSIEYYVTDDTDGFGEMASLFLQSDVRGIVKKVTLGTA